MQARTHKNITRRTYDAVAKEYAARDRGVVPEKSEVVAAIRKFKRLVRPRIKILDIGCGTGRDSCALSASGFKVVGIDFSERMVAQAKRETTITYKVMDFEQLRFRNDEFAGIWANASLHHIPKRRLKSVLKRIYRILAPGGIFFVKVKHGAGEGLRENMKFGKRIRRYFAFYRPHELTSLLNATRFYIISQKVTGNGEWLDTFARK